MRTPCRRSVAAAVVTLPVLLAACGGGGPTAATTLPPTTTTIPGAVTNVTVPMQTPTGGEFLSPSGNIGCEVDYHRAGLTGVYCQTVTPPQSVKVSPSGTLTKCSGQQCLGNSGTGTPALSYGEVTGVGPYRCVSTTTGITCTVGGKGFHISTSGITSVTTPA